MGGLGERGLASLEGQREVYPKKKALDSCHVLSACASPGVDEQLFRSVEGQAASDEEEEAVEKWPEEQRPSAATRKLLAEMSNCGSRYVSPIQA